MIPFLSILFILQHEKKLMLVCIAVLRSSWYWSEIF